MRRRPADTARAGNRRTAGNRLASLARTGRHALALALALACMGLASASRADAEPSYVGSGTCSGCHEAAASAWAGSHHALAWTPADPEHALGDFDDAVFEHAGTRTRFLTEGDTLAVEVTEADGSTRRHRVHSLAGVAPLQQLLIETEPGRIQSFDVVWDTERGRWYHLYPDQTLPPGDGLHWTGPYKSWNARCAECHATDYRKTYDPAARSYASTEAEWGVGCEACHGPGSAHVDLVRNGRAPPEGLSDKGLTVSLAAGAEAEIQQCAGCHSRRESFEGGSPRPGTPFHDAYRLSTLREGLYHADGQILDEVYVHGSFLQSRMYARGVRCSDCHEPHAATLKAPGNAVCTQCHNPDGNARFPTLRPAAYDDPAHHHHAEGTAGASCTSCHMIERTYMGVDGRRDHSFRVPRPDLGARLGTPDACTDCHDDRSPEWAADAVAEWYPGGRQTEPHYGEVLAHGRADPAGAVAELVTLANDAAMPAIVRATALDLLARAPSPAVASDTATLLGDTSPLVREAASGLQRGATGPERVLRLLPLLDDPARAVRIATARALIDVDPASLPRSQVPALSEAMREWQQATLNNADFPETQMVLGGIGLTTRNVRAAQAAFGEATRLDPQLVDAWAMQVRIARAIGAMQEARVLLARALSHNPGDPALAALRGQLDR